MRNKFVVCVGLWVLVAVLFTLTTGCQIKMKDGGAVGLRIITGQVGVEFYHEAKLTSGDPIIRTDVDKGVAEWMFGEDTDGDGELDMSVEPVDGPVE